MKNNFNYLSSREFAVGIWLFRINGNTPVLKGVYSEGLLQWLTERGYYQYLKEGKELYVQDEGSIIRPVTENQLQSVVSDYILQEMGDLRFDFHGQYYIFKAKELRNVYLSSNYRAIFNRKFLKNLGRFAKTPLQEDKGTSYIPFANGILRIRKGEIKKLRYSSLKNKFVWKTQVCPHHFRYIKDNEGGHFAQFVRNVSDNDPARIKSIRSAIGYLLHAYNDPTRGQAVICYDDVDYTSTIPEGGRGKGILVQALKQLRRVVKIDGKRFSSDDKFRFQEVRPESQIVFLDDVKSNFDFDQVNSVLTDGMNVEIKHHSSFLIPAERTPKFIITSNYFMDNNGTTRKRRQFIIGFSDYYSRQIINGTEEPVLNAHGCRFFSDEWDTTEWSMFYSYMIDCVSLYMKEGLVPYDTANIRERGLAQKTCREFVAWAKDHDIKPETEYNTKELYESFMAENSGLKLEQRRFSGCWLKEYAAVMGWKADFKTNNGTNLVVFRFKI